MLGKRSSPFAGEQRCGGRGGKTLPCSPAPLLLCVLLLLQAGCSQESPSELPSVTLEFMIWGDTSEVATVQEYVRAFEKKFPAIRIQIQHAPPLGEMGYRQKLGVRMRSGTLPDVMYVDMQDFDAWAGKDVFLDLTPSMERDETFRLADYFEPIMKRFEVGGRYFGLAKDFTTLVLYYNRDLFDKWGVPYPEEGWTWDDLLERAKKLTRDTDGDGKPDEYGLTVETWFGEWVPWLWQNAGEVLSEDGTRCLLGDPAYVEKNAEALQFLADLIWKHRVAPTPAVTSDLGTADIFMTGRVAMCTYGRWMSMRFKDIRNFDWAIAPLPQKLRKATTLFTVCYSIAKNTKHPKEAWEFVKFLLGAEGQIAVAEAGHAIPVLREIAYSDHFLKAKVLEHMPHNAKIYLDELAVGRMGPRTTLWQEIDAEVSRELLEVFHGRQEAREALRRVQEKVERILRDGHA